MGHVVNYAYRLYETEEWVEQFGSITQPYLEEYRLEPFSRRYVRHLPGWYAQKHPDEDWAETFAVWMTPGLDWRDDYADWPEALAKLQYCDRTMAALADLDPVVTADDLDEDVGELAYSVDQFYGDPSGVAERVPRRARRRPPLDLRGPGPSRVRPARRPPRPGLGADPSPRARPGGDRLPLDRPLPRADPPPAPPPRRPRRPLRQVYPQEHETPAIVALTTLVTTLAMNHVHRGDYLL